MKKMQTQKAASTSVNDLMHYGEYPALYERKFDRPHFNIEINAYIYYFPRLKE